MAVAAGAPQGEKSAEHAVVVEPRVAVRRRRARSTGTTSAPRRNTTGEGERERYHHDQQPHLGVTPVRTSSRQAARRAAAGPRSRPHAGADRDEPRTTRLRHPCAASADQRDYTTSELSRPGRNDSGRAVDRDAVARPMTPIFSIIARASATTPQATQRHMTPERLQSSRSRARSRSG